MSDTTPTPPARPASRPRSRLAIFLSSTSLDLSPHRTRVRHVVEKFDEHPVVMDDFGAQDGGAIKVSLGKLASAHIYILLLGWRYGTIPAGETLSVTHMEYRAARDAGLPRLIFLTDDATERDDGPDALFPAATRDPEHAVQLRAFREEVAHDRVIARFTTPESLIEAVVIALHQTIPHVVPPGPLPPNKLAPRARGFVGRTDELRQLCERLRAGNSVGLSALVAGMGGVGKSALAAEAQALLASEPDAFPGGVTALRCDERGGLAGLTWLYDQLLADWDVPLAPEQVAQAQTAGPDAEAELRERALHARFRAFALPDGTLPPALALLDNVEPGLPLARALDTLAALNVTALVTARHQPSVSRLEVLWLDVLEPLAAVQLFAERYRAQGAVWDDARDTAPAAKVAEYLGWLPLAIELQAARAALRRESVAQLAATLEHDHSQGLLGDPLDATRNLRYSFAQSLKTLTPLQRTRFAALGLPGGPDWPRSVIERLLAGIQDGEEAGASDDDEDDEPSARAHAAAGDDLDLLAALSLAILLPDGRVRLHPLLREYAHERWQDEPADTQRTGLRALLYGIFDFVTEHEHDFAALALEEEMIVAALDQAHAAGTASLAVIRVVATLSDYLYIGGHWRLGMRLLQGQLAARRAVGNRAGEGATLNNLGGLARSLGQPGEARAYYEQALVIVREIGAVDTARVVADNLAYLDDKSASPGETPAADEPAIPPEKTPQRKRRWWQRGR